MRLNGASSQGAKKAEAHPVVDDMKPKPRAPDPGMQRGSRRGKLVCWGWGNEGHVQRNCPHPKPHPSNSSNETHRETHQTPSNIVMRGCKGLDNDPVYLGMRLVGKMIPCLLDTGCDVTLVPQDIIEKHKSIRMTPVNRYLQAANDTDIGITGEVILPLMLNDRCIMTHALVSLM